jgi:hypothetical protein
MFEPSSLAPGPSGFADRPRPFVFRATHLDGLTIGSGAAFHFDLNLFDTASPAIDSLVLAFAELARDGLGPGRGKIELTQVSHLHGDKLEPLELNLDPPDKSVSRLLVRFVTPTELKSGEQIAAQPDFGVLAARARDRIGTLSQLYGDGALSIDFCSFGEKAALVRMNRCQLRTVVRSRRSSRTGQVHSTGGFIGQAEYEGDLTEFVPYLKAASWTGVGRQTVWGKGQIEVDSET